ncbi:MAG: hypothetical protein WCL00_03035, partial [Bacteroidota bacterium]
MVKSPPGGRVLPCGGIQLFYVPPMIYLSSVLKRCSLAAGLLATSLAIGDPATRIETARQPVVDSYHG